MKKTLALLLLMPLFLFAQDDSLLKIKKVDDIIHELSPEQPEATKADLTPVDEKKEPEKVIEEEPTEKKEPIKKEEPAHETSFSGTLTPADVFLEYGTSHIQLWVRSRNFLGSVALITPYHQWKGKNRYFLRSRTRILEQKHNTIYYKGKPLSDTMYFLASSSPEEHPLLGQAFKIIIPSEVVYGYNKFAGKISLKPGQSEFVIRAFEKPFGQGRFKDTIYLLRKSSISQSINRNTLQLAKKEKSDSFVDYYFSYSSPHRGKKYILLSDNGVDTELYQTGARLLPQEEATHQGLNILHWNYDFGKPGFHMIFNLTLDKRAAKILTLIVLEENEPVSYKIDLTQEP